MAVDYTVALSHRLARKYPAEDIPQPISCFDMRRDVLSLIFRNYQLVDIVGSGFTGDSFLCLKRQLLDDVLLFA